MLGGGEVLFKLVLQCRKISRFLSKVKRPLRKAGLSIPHSWPEIEDVIIKNLRYFEGGTATGPGFIVGTGSGGAILAGMVSTNVSNGDTPFVGLDREINYETEDEATRSAKGAGKLDFATLLRPYESLIRNQHVLVTSAEIISGGTTIEVIRALKAYRPKAVSVFCIDYNHSKTRLEIGNDDKGQPTFTCNISKGETIRGKFFFSEIASENQRFTKPWTIVPINQLDKRVRK